VPGRDGIVQPGERAPDFSLGTAGGAKKSLADLEGETKVLVFYPFAFSPVCTDQFNLYEEVRDELAAKGATLYGVSCDSAYAQQAFAESLGVSIEQLSDFEPKGEVCRAFGVYHPGGFPERALVAIGPDGVVVWSHQAENPGVLPGANLIFDGLERAAATAG
jgi:peroxiredoxin